MRAAFGDELSSCDTSHTLYKFYRNFPEVHSTVVHFQLRNLIWSTSCHDVFVVHNNRIVHWNILTGDSTVVLDLTGTKSDSLARSMGVVHISTSCVKGSLAAAGVHCFPVVSAISSVHEAFRPCANSTPTSTLNTAFKWTGLRGTRFIDCNLSTEFPAYCASCCTSALVHCMDVLRACFHDEIAQFNSQ